MLGLIGKKVGMTQVYDEQGVMTPVTVIKFEDNVIVGKRDVKKDGYEACVMGTVDKKSKQVKKPYAGQFPEGIEPKQFLYEMRDFDLEAEIGQKYGVELLDELKFVDVIGTTKGKGYQGVMKRHGFSGGRATHGSKFHRANGSTGMAAYPSRVIKGTKMAGRMGGERKTVQNLKVVRVDAEKQIILVKGAVPGTRNSVVLVRRAKKK
ncbi:MAG: 50S ribosomal protein L3 [Spirochaetales bacterium]|nr:50S ribosomal protein L3 [Spirochaetales bacterium]